MALHPGDTEIPAHPFMGSDPIGVSAGALSLESQDLKGGTRLTPTKTVC
jgi:hypothetical protein